MSKAYSMSMELEYYFPDIALYLSCVLPHNKYCFYSPSRATKPQYISTIYTYWLMLCSVLKGSSAYSNNLIPLYLLQYLPPIQPSFLRVT